MEKLFSFIVLVVGIAASSVADITFHPAGKLPSSLVKTASVYDDLTNSIYIFGGHISNHEFVNDVLKFDIETGTIENISKFPLKSISGGTAHIDREGNFYYIGGLTNKDGFGEFSSVIYKLTRGETVLKEIGQLPTTLSNHCSIYDGANGFFIMGGSNLLEYNKNFYYYNFLNNSTWTFHPEPTVLRTSAPCIGYESSSYIFGGYGPTFDGPKYHTDIIKSNPVNQKVETLEVQFKETIIGGSAVLTKSSDVFIIGGNELHKFSITKESLQAIKVDGLGSTTDASSVYVPNLNRIYVIGGLSAASGFTDEIFYLQL